MSDHDAKQTPQRVDEHTDPKPGIYLHYKGARCEVIGVAHHSETLEELVVYREAGNELGPLWVRPRAMFLGEVTVNGRKTPRFTRIDNTA